MATYDTKYDNVNKIGNTLNDISSNAYLELIKQAENSGKEFDSNVNKANISAYNSLQADIAAAKKKTEDITKNAYGEYSNFADGVTTQTAKSLGLNAYQKRKYEAEKTLKESIDKSVLAYNSLKASGQIAAAKSEMENAQRLVGLRNKLLDASIENDKFVYDAMSKERSFEQKKINEDRDYDLGRRKLNDRIEKAKTQLSSVNNTQNTTPVVSTTDKNNENHSYKVQADERAELQAEKAYGRAKTDKEKQVVVEKKYYGDAERSLAYNPNYNMPAEETTVGTAQKAMSDTALTFNEKVVVLDKYLNNANSVAQYLSKLPFLELIDRSTTEYVENALGVGSIKADEIIEQYKYDAKNKQDREINIVNAVLDGLDLDDASIFTHNLEITTHETAGYMAFIKNELENIKWMSPEEADKWYDLRSAQVSQYIDSITKLENVANSGKRSVDSNVLEALKEMKEFLELYKSNIGTDKQIYNNYASEDEYNNAVSDYEAYIKTPEGKASRLTVEERKQAALDGDNRIKQINADIDGLTKDSRITVTEDGRYIRPDDTYTYTLSDGRVVTGRKNEFDTIKELRAEKTGLEQEIQAYKRANYNIDTVDKYKALSDDDKALFNKVMSAYNNLILYNDDYAIFYNDYLDIFHEHAKQFFKGKMSEDEYSLYDENKTFDTSELFKQYRSGKNLYVDDIERHKTSIKIEEFTKSHPILANTLATVSTVFAPLDIVGVAASVANNRYPYSKDGYSPSSVDMFTPVAEFRDSVRGTTSGTINNPLGGFIYNTSMSMVDSVIGMAIDFVMPGSGALLLSSSAAASAARQVVQNGGTTGQAIMTGLLNGVSEWAFEKWSIGNFKKLALSNNITGIKSAVTNTLKSIGVNASEEGLTSVANKISDYFVNKYNSDSNRQMIYNMRANGMSAEEAENAAFWEDIKGVLLESAGGAFMGGVFGSAGSAYNYSRNTKSQYIAQYANTKYEAPLNAAQTLIDNYTSGKASTDEQINKLLFNYDADVTNVIRGLFEQSTGVALPASNSDVVNLLKNPTANAYSNYLADTSTNTGISEIDNSANAYIQAAQNSRNAYASQQTTDTSNKINTYIPKDGSDMDLKMAQTIQDANDIISGLDVNTKYNSSPVEIKSNDGTLTVNSVNESSIADKSIVDTMKAGRSVAEIFGDKVVYITGDMTLDGNVVSGNGLNDGNGTLYVSLDSVTDDNMLNWIVGHEIGHDVLGTDSKKIKAFKDTFVKYAYNGNTAQYKADVDIQLDKIKENGVYKNTPSDELRIRAEYEVMADKFGDFIATINSAEDLKSIISKNPSLWQRVLEAIRNVIKKLQAYIKDKKGNTTENSEAYKLSVNLQKAERAIAGALREYISKPNSISNLNEKSNNKSINFTLNENKISSDDYSELKDYFGTTKNYNVAGYLLNDGTMLDFSGRKQGAGQLNQRSIDHRDIAIDGVDMFSEMDGTDAMITMIANGNVRLSPEIGGINLAVMPTDMQISTLRDYISYYRGEVTVDIDEPGYDTIESAEYSRGTSSSRIISDIKNYFENGTVPKGTYNPDIRYSLRKNKNESLKTINARLEKKNEALTKAVEAARNELKLSHGKIVDKTALNKFTNHILDTYHVQDKANRSDIKKYMADLFTDIREDKNISNDGLLRAVDRAAMFIMERSGEIDKDSSMYNDAQTIKKYLKGITLSEGEHAELKAVFGDKWRKYLPGVYTRKGSVKSAVNNIAFSNSSIDGAIGDLKSRLENAEQIFPEDMMNSGDLIIRAVETIRDYGTAEFIEHNWASDSMTAADAAEYLRADILGGLYNVAEYKTFADKQKAIIDNLKNKFKLQKDEAVNAIKDKYRAEMTDDEKTKLLNDRKGALKELTTTDTDNIEMVENYKKAVDNYGIMLENELKYKKALSVLKKGSSEYKAVESAYRSAKEKTKTWNAKAAIIENSKAFNSLVKSAEISKPRAYRTADRKKLDITTVKANERYSKRAESIRQKQVEKIKNKYIDSIKKRVDTLTKYIVKPDVKTGRYIPEIFKNAVLEFMTSLDFTKPEERIAKGDIVPAKTNIKSNLKWQQKMKYLSDAILNDKSEIYKVALPETFEQRLNEFYLATGGKPLYQLSVSELKELNTLSSMMLSTVTNANKMHKSIYFKTVEDAVVQTAADMKELKSVGKGNGLKNLLTYNYALPINVYERLGEAGKKLFKELSNGQNNYMNRLTRDLSGFLDDLKTKNKDIYKTARDDKGVQPFKVIGKKGEFEVPLSLNERMTIYLANKRKQYKDHIVGQNAGGYELNNELIDALVDRYKGKKSEYRKELVKQGTISFSEDEINNVISSLSDDEKAFADEISTFLSTVVSEWGNEVTMERYGIRYFTEKNYIPIVSAKMLKESVSGNENTSAYALDNKSFTKNPTPGADNPIKLQGLLDIVVTHSADMALYSGFSIPVNNILKWLAYNEERTINGKTYRVGTQSRIKEVFGEKSIDYLYTLIKDITKANKPDYMAGLLNKGLIHVKSALVGANLRVAIQQPASIARASVVIPQPYLVAAAAKSPVQLKKNIQEGRKHNALFNWKSFGYFDMDIGKPIVDKLLDRTTVIGKAKNASMALPGLADDMAWGVMWEAAKLKVKHDNKNIVIGSEGYWNKVNELFDETILKTQVVDTVLSRTQVMRSKDFGVKQLTSFMNESLTTFNMLFSDAYMATKVTDKALKKSYVKKTVRNAIVFIQSMVVLALAQSLYDASKDDDKDKPWLDRFTAEFLDNFITNLNPLSLLPISNQVASALQYGSQNLLFESVDSLKSAYSKIKKFKESEHKTTKQWYDVFYYGARVGSMVSGIPISNLIRDAWIGLNEILAATGNSAIGAEYSIPDYGSKMYKAIVNKDTETYDKAYGQAYDKLIKSGKTKAQAESAIQSAILNQLKKDSDVIEAANLRIAGKFSEASKLISKVSGKGFNLKDVQDAVKSLDTSYQNQIGNAAQHIIDGNQAEADKIISALQYQGNDKKTIDADIEAAKAEKQNEKAKAYRYANSQKEGVSDEIISYSDMMRTTFKGKDENHDGRADSGTIKADIRNYVLGLSGLSGKQKQTLYEDMLGSDTNPGSLEEYSKAKSKLSKYGDFKSKLTVKEQEEVYLTISEHYTDETPDGAMTYINKAGIDIATYAAYVKITNKETADKDKNGKIITNSLKNKIITDLNNTGISYDKKLFLLAFTSNYNLSNTEKHKVINYISSLSISKSEKNILYAKCGLLKVSSEERKKMLHDAGFAGY